MGCCSTNGVRLLDGEMEIFKFSESGFSESGFGESGFGESGFGELGSAEATGSFEVSVPAGRLTVEIVCDRSTAITSVSGLFGSVCGARFGSVSTMVSP